MNPFDLNPARAYSNPDAFCPRPDLSALLARAAAGRLWTLIVGERRMGKSSAIIADCVRARRRILHVDLVGVTATEDINERFRWAWTVFRQQEASGIFGGLTAELAASIPVTGVEMKLTGQHAETPQNWGDVIMAFDKRAKKSGGLLFWMSFRTTPSGGQRPEGDPQSPRGPANGQAHRARARRFIPAFALPLFRTSAAAFFKGIRLQHQLGALAKDQFVQWAGDNFKQQQFHPATATRRSRSAAEARQARMAFSVR